MLFRQLDGKTYAVLVPEWSRERLEAAQVKFTYEHVPARPSKPSKPKKTKSRLGRGLKDLLAQPKPQMQPLFPPPKK